MRQFIKWGLMPLVAVIAVLADQWTKGLVERSIPQGGAVVPFPALEPYFKLIHTTNSGAAFGMLQGLGGLFIVIPILVVAAVLYFARHLPADNWPIRLCLGFQLGGAIGNLIDRLQHGGLVTDFLLFTLPVGDKVYQWPAFNVADTSIVVGTIVLALLLLRLDSGERREEQPAG